MSDELFQMEQNTGQCPRCDATLQNPADDYEMDDNGVPSVVPGLWGFWCAACGWDEAADHTEGNDER